MSELKGRKNWIAEILCCMEDTETDWVGFARPSALGQAADSNVERARVWGMYGCQLPASEGLTPTK